MFVILLIVVAIGYFHLSNKIKDLETLLKDKNARTQGSSSIPNPPSYQPPISANTAPVMAQAATSTTPPQQPTTNNFNSPVNSPLAPLNTPEPKREIVGDTTEFALGSKVFTTVGIIAVFLGVGFFLRYAFENNLISPLMRVMLGVSFGVVLSLIGHFLKGKYKGYALALFGAGIGVIYVSTYAAFAFYTLLSVGSAFALLSLITIIGVSFALLYDSKQLVSFAFLGAFIIPYILPLTLNVHSFFIFFVIVNLGILLIARFKVWPELTAGSLIATSLSLLKWNLGGDLIPVLTTQIYVAAIFLIYFTSSLINFIRRENNYKGVDSFLLYAIPTFYFLLNLPLVEGKLETALFIFIIAIFYFSASILIRSLLANVGETKTFSNALFFIGSIFLVIATSIYFDGVSLTLIVALESVLMLFMGVILNTRLTRIAALCLSFLIVCKALIVDSGSLEILADPIFNSRAAAYLFIFLSVASFWIYYKFIAVAKEKEDEEEKSAGSIIGALGVWILPLVWLSLEAGHFLAPENDQVLPLLWLAFSAIAISASFAFSEKIFRFSSYLVLIYTAFAILIRYSFLNEDATPIFNIRMLLFVGLSLVLTLTLALFKKYPEQIKESEVDAKNVILAVANLSFLWVGSLEIRDMYQSSLFQTSNMGRVMLSLFWLVYGLIALGVGIATRSMFARYLSIILLGITILKIFVYDTQNLSDLYRFISFIVLGIILLIVGFVYYRFKDRITEFVSTEKIENI